MFRKEGLQSHTQQHLSVLDDPHVHASAQQPDKKEIQIYSEFNFSDRHK